MLKLKIDNRYLPGEMSLLVALGFDLLVALELPLCNASLSSCSTRFFSFNARALLCSIVVLLP